MKHDNAPSRKPSLEEIARALGGEISAGQVLAPGPGHSPQDRSLAIKMSDTGYVVHSFAGDDPIQCKDYVRDKLGMPRWQPSRGNGHDAGFHRDPVVASYIYKDANGNPHLRVQRTAAKRFWQQQWNGSTWEKGAAKERIPYRLPELLAADPTDPVYIVEGEKDADRLASLGFVATTSSGGSNGKWPDLSEPFADRTVYIIPDNDEPGHKYAQRVAQHLHSIAAKVAIVELPGLGPRTSDHGPDVSDWLDLGNQGENLRYIAEQSPEWTPPTPKDGWRAHVFTAASLREKKFEPISYVVPQLIPEGVTIFAGKPKIGKSWAALDIALAKAGGRFVFGDIHLIEGDVLYCALEDNDRRLRSLPASGFSRSPQPLQS
jgi:hypothetical protein